MNQAISKHYRPTIRLGWPIVVGQIGLIVVNFADNMMISYHSLQELAAASFVNNFLGLFYILGLGFSYGLTPLIAGSYQQHNHNDTAQWLTHGVIINTALGLLLFGITFVLQFFLSHFNLSDDLMPRALPYYRLQVYSIILTMIFAGIKQFFDGILMTNTAMIITITGNLINIILNYALIYGHWGAPEMGLYGAGIATMISRVYMIIVAIALIALSERLRLIRQALHKVRLQLQSFITLGRLSVPIAIQMGCEAAAFSIAVIFIAKLGTNALAAHQITNIMTTFGFMIYYGIGAATTIRVSTFHAEGRHDEAQRAARAALHIAWASGVLMILFVMISYRAIATYLFNVNDEVMSYVALAIIPIYFLQYGDSLQIIYTSALRGLKKVNRPAVMALMCYVVLSPLLNETLGFHIGLTNPRHQLMAIWFAFPISIGTFGVIMYYYFQKSIRRAKTM